MANLAKHGGARSRSHDATKRTEYLAFVLAGESYAVEIARIAEILKVPAISRVPRTPPHVLGIISVRGRLLTVIDLRVRLRLAARPVDSRCRILLTMTPAGEPIGFVVDEVKSVYRLADSEVEPASMLGGDQPAHIRGIGRSSDAVLILLDLTPLAEELS
jgi:purine-binding chemotaxis protein CheW